MADLSGRFLRSVTTRHKPAPLMLARFPGLLLPAHPATFKVGWPPGPYTMYVIAHYRGENGRKFDVTNKQREKIDGFEQKVAQKCTSTRIKKQARKATPTTDRRRARTRSRTYERQKRAPSAHARTIVRTEHQAHCAHPAVGIH